MSVPGNSRALMMRRRGGAAIVLPPAPPAAFALGFNLSGFEGDQYNSSGGANIVAAMVNTYLPYFAGKGFVKVRLPFAWGRMQPAVDGDLDPAYLGHVKQVVAAAAALGMRVRLDSHSYGVGPGGLLGSSSQPVETFGRFWGKMATAFHGLAGVAQYDLNNEWHSMDPNFVDFIGDRGIFDKPVNPASDYAKTLIFVAQQQAITAIRAIDTASTVVIEGLHYSGAWDWLTNNTNLFGLVDPQNNIMFSAHCYLDNDSSGTNFGWATETAKPGAAPPGVPSSATVGVTRLTAFMTEITRRGLRADVGEFGASSDVPPAGADDYADWNAALDTMIAFAQTNRSEMYYFCAGPGYDSYPMSLNPAGGFQARQMVILDKYHGFPGTQPTNYILRYPLDSAGRAITRTPVGVASGAFLVDYRGKLDTPALITPHAMLMDGTDAGGTFTPATITLAPGLNAIGAFTYTPALDGATFIVSTTNTEGWTDPAPLGFSSKIDALARIPASVNLRTVFGLRRLVSSYIGTAITLKRASDATTRTFSFNNRGDLPRQAIQDWAGSRTIPVVSLTYQDGSGTVIDFTTYKDECQHPASVHAAQPDARQCGWISRDHLGRRHEQGAILLARHEPDAAIHHHARQARQRLLHDGQGRRRRPVAVLSHHLHRGDKRQTRHQPWRHDRGVPLLCRHVLLGRRERTCRLQGRRADRCGERLLPSIAAIRAAGATQLILIAGIDYQNAGRWTTSGNSAAWQTFNQPGWTGMNGDPANNFAFEMHQYLDQYTTGTAPDCTISDTTFASATAWLMAYGYKGFVGEIGWPPDTYASASAGCSTKANTLLNDLNAHFDVWLGWTFFAGGSRFKPAAYITGIGPAGAPGAYADAAQMAVLTAHL